VGVGAVILDDEGRLLCVKRGRAPAMGRWSLPGGRIEAGETAAEAVAREVFEETGLQVEVGDLIGHVDIIGEDRHYVVLDFAATVVGGIPEAGDDAAEVAWLTRRDLDTRRTTDQLMAFLDAHTIAVAD
jgi:acetyl-CoA carboxylase carboxyl transferase subunit beta